VRQFAILTPIEPRLVRKLLPPLTHLISTTPAMSLLYECIHAVIVGNMLADNDQLAKVCVNKLSSFLADVDQNRPSLCVSWWLRLMHSQSGTSRF
jgi:AP-3 complex subunit delta-1